MRTTGERPIMSDLIVVYLLHYDNEPNAAIHYIGSARLDQFDRRMKAHSHDYGATHTLKLARIHECAWIGNQWMSNTRALEHALHRLTDPSPLCACCTPTLRRFHNPRLLKIEKKPAHLSEHGLSHWTVSRHPK